MQSYDRNIRVTSGLLLATSLFLSGSFTAVTSAESLEEQAAQVITGKTDEGVRYMMGGVGIGERDLMQSRAEEYNLKLSFAEKVGVYLADVDVVVEDRSGKKIISRKTNGPWLYLQLPPGTYDVKATFEGETKELKNVRVTSAARLTRVMRWDLPEEFPIYASMKMKQG
jgi:hypothetical protein